MAQQGARRSMAQQGERAARRNKAGAQHSDAWG